MSRIVSLTLPLCLLSLVSFACSSSPAPATEPVDAGTTPASTPRACPDVGASRCDGARVQTCETSGDGTAWSTSTASVPRC